MCVSECVCKMTVCLYIWEHDCEWEHTQTRDDTHKHRQWISWWQRTVSAPLYRWRLPYIQSDTVSGFDGSASGRPGKLFRILIASEYWWGECVCVCVCVRQRHCEGERGTRHACGKFFSVFCDKERNRGRQERSKGMHVTVIFYGCVQCHCHKQCHCLCICASVYASTAVSKPAAHHPASPASYQFGRRQSNNVEPLSRRHQALNQEQDTAHEKCSLALPLQRPVMSKTKKPPSSIRKWRAWSTTLGNMRN